MFHATQFYVFKESTCLQILLSNTASDHMESLSLLYPTK